MTTFAETLQAARHKAGQHVSASNQRDLFGEPVVGPLASSNARIDRQLAEMARDTGMQRVQHSAGEEWLERAVGYVMEYVATPSTLKRFLCEDVRAYAESKGFDRPPNPKAWGPVMQRAAKRGVVRACGYAPANSSNRSPKVCWQAVL